MLARAKRPTKMEDQSSDDDEDALEMEQNFALLRKRSAFQITEEDEEGYYDEEMRVENGSAEDDEAPEEHEGDEDDTVDDEGDSGCDEDVSESDSDPEEAVGGSSTAKSHTEYNIKKADKQKLELAYKYSELKKSRKLENFLSKKRKRNATKDSKKLPNHTEYGPITAPLMHLLWIIILV
ncbi:nucleoplasmin-like protein ANO39 [Myxocyprinus asiaticus]|uniref:nucleoplasmin-like protein ANO39 n=1 Tax=Myxocyprinus asiaticus TaxID=70543 RepID=UPI0022228828|nr:nucleoplasmin-like protein ANO39 [Myxocyprinus asiaticus]